MVVRDETQVVAAEPPRRLELVARGRPFGEARIELQLADEDGGCRVTMREEPIAGPVKLLNNAIGDAVLHWRNGECLLRLKALAERRTEPLR
jgi:hypothetical protein